MRHVHLALILRRDPVQSTHNDGEPLSQDLTLAFRESEGFFSDQPLKDWLRRKSRFASTPVGKGVSGRGGPTPRAWYQNNWEPTFSCAHERRIGGAGDGPKWYALARPHWHVDLLTQSWIGCATPSESVRKRAASCTA